MPSIYAILGTFFTFSHVFTISFGMNLKLPELLIALIIFLHIPLAPRITNAGCRKILMTFIVALLCMPFFSNLFSIYLYPELAKGAARLGFENPLGRKHPLFSPWIMLGWNVFSFLTVYVCASILEKDRFVFFRYLLISIFILNVYSLWHGIAVNYGGLRDIPWIGDVRHRYSGQLRNQGFFMEPLNLGHFLIYCFPVFFIHKDIFPAGAKRFFFEKLNLILTGISFVLSFSTSAVVSLIFGYIAILFICKRLNFKLVVKLFFIGIIAIIAIAQNGRARTFFIDKIVLSVSNSGNIKDVGPSLADRIHKNQTAIAIFEEHPILGTGLGTAAFFYPDYSPVNSESYYQDLPIPLNEYLRMLAETGIIGFAAFVIFALLYLLLLRKNSKYFTTPELLLYGGGFIASLAAFNFSSLFNAYFIWFFVGFSLAVVQQRSSDTKLVSC